MSWTAYKLVYRALSPVHIGYHKLGFIQRTRYYITGKNMWGTMTANLARSQRPAAMKDYGIFGGIMKTTVMASYFFPALDPKQPFIPSYKNGGLMYGEIKADQFERQFISSVGKTAITPSSNTAEDESLHETEFISNLVKEGAEVKQVYFVGYLFIKDGVALNGKSIGWNSGDIQIESAVKELFVGGERKYGFGRLVLVEEKPKPLGIGEKIFGLGNDLTGDSVKFKLNTSDVIPAHMKVNGAASLKGDIEPLVGREWGEGEKKNGETPYGAGQKVSKAEVCWVPGSVLNEEKNFELGEFGIMEAQK